MRIVIGVDQSTEAEEACWFVADRSWPAGTSATLAGVSTPRAARAAVAAVDAAHFNERSADIEAVLDQRAEIFRRTGRLNVQTELLVGTAGDALCRLAADTHADLIVVGSRRRGPLSSAILGSTSAQLVDHAPCPVLVVRQPLATRMLVATDGTPSSRSIPTILAAWRPAFHHLPVEVVSVAQRYAFITPWAASEPEDAPAVEDLAFHRQIAERVADQLIELGWHSAAVARAGEPGREIVAAGEEWGADLIVTGSRGIGTLHRLLTGSVAHDVLLHTRSSVLVVRGQVPASSGRVAVAGVASLLG